MGGVGSGRLPSEATIVERMSVQQQKPIMEGMFLPNYSGVQAAALKTAPAISTGSALTTLMKYKTADQTNPNIDTTMVADNDIVLTLEASSFYIGRILFKITTGAAIDYKYQFTSSNGDILYGNYPTDNLSTAAVSARDLVTSGITILGTGTAYQGFIDLYIQTTTACTLTLNFGQNTAGATLAVNKAGTCIYLTKMATVTS